MKAHIVVVHHNAALKLVRTYRAFRDRLDPDVTFVLIDQSSGRRSFLLASLITKWMTARSMVIQRPNEHREAGGYWHYINHVYDGTPDIIVFTQDELHQRGMRPKGVPKGHDTASRPFYPERYGSGGISLHKCLGLLSRNPLDTIGFGGRRCRNDVDFDPRFTTPHWRARWRHLDLAWYDFFSGACFCVGPRGMAAYRDLAEPTSEDLADPHFAWMWERMWGTVPAAAGGRLVHYETGTSDQVEEYSPDTRRNPDLVSQTVSQRLSGPLGVRRDTARCG
jgi:hypothetical protein